MLLLIKTAKLSVVYNATTDENHLLGRPNGYTSKVAFVDTRIDPSQATTNNKGSADLGGSIESYPDAAGAVARAKYIQSVFAANPIIGSEYDYVAGVNVLRVSGMLTPVQAKAYAAVASKVTGEPAKLITAK